MRAEVVKRMCGNDEITTRSLYSNNMVKFKLRTKFVIAMNSLPTFTRVDDALWRRLVVINFGIKFTRIPKHKHEKRINEHLLDQIEDNPQLYNQFIQLLLQYYTGSSISESELPEKFACLLDEIKAVEDAFGLFLVNNVIYDINSVLTIREILEKALECESIPEPNTSSYKTYSRKIHEYIQNVNASLDLKGKDRIHIGAHRREGKVVRGIRGLSFNK